MTNWQFFVKLVRGYKSYFRFPSTLILEERDKMLKDNIEAVAYYFPDENKIYILRDYNNHIVLFHEYGHWINACIYFLLEIVWEFLWWGISLRSIVKREKEK